MDKAKKEFIFKRGILGTGVPVAVLMSFTAGFQVPGYIFKLQSFHVQTFLWCLLFSAPIFICAGYFWGIFVYTVARKK